MGALQQTKVVGRVFIPGLSCLLAFAFALMVDPVSSVGEAFGDEWSFLPIAALIVDVVLTIAIVCPPLPPQ